MAERYTRVFTLENRLYAENSPVIIEAGAILKDNKTGGLLAQLKFKNIGGRVSHIKALRVQITQFDISGNTLGTPIEFQYLDISIPRDEMFGSKTPIPLTDANTRKITVAIIEAVFGDGFIWSQISNTSEVLAVQKTIKESLRDDGLVEQFQLEFGNNCTFEYVKHQDLWLCPCGAINRASEETCHVCKNKVSGFAALDVGALAARKAERKRKAAKAEAERQKKAAKEAEARRLEEERRAKELEQMKAEQKKKMIKRIAIATPIIIICIVFLVLLDALIIPELKYNNAISLMSRENYSAAIAQFESLDGYKDSDVQMKNCQYNQAVAFMNENNYEDAMKLFRALNDFKNSSSILKEIYKQLLSNAKIGDSIIFGTYEQDNDENNGQEPIEWIVLDKQGDKVFVISKYALDACYFDISTIYQPSWVGSSMEYFLDGSFQNAAFSETERNMIIEKDTKIHPSGAQNLSRVFLLSRAEVEKYFPNKEQRLCLATPFAKAKGAFCSASGHCDWWLRTQSQGDDDIDVVWSDLVASGEIHGKNADRDSVGVRPAMWIAVTP